MQELVAASTWSAASSTWTVLCQQYQADAASLLVAFRSGIPNFANNVAVKSSRTPCSLAGNWLCVTCTEGQLTGLDFEDISLAGLPVWTLTMFYLLLNW